MSDAPGLAGGGHETAPTVPLTAGATLRRAREQAGLHIGALAVALKVPVKKLEALESDQLDQLPDAVFARALASSVCRSLKLDPGPVLGLLPEQALPPLSVAKRIGGESFDTPGVGRRLPFLSGLPKPVLVSAGLLLAAALVLFVLPSFEIPGLVRVPVQVEVAQGGPSLSARVVTSTPVVPAAAAVAVPPVAAGSAIAVVISPPAGLPASAEIVGAPSVSEPKADAAASGSGLLVFKARGASWVEVTDAGGVVQLRKTMAHGETASASGALPLSVIVGRADVTDVLVRGAAFDIAPSSRDNVARFQIK